jgi:glycosyltransferase involved in cell wall biosynthesis
MSHGVENKERGYLVIPVLNEEESIGKVIQDILDLSIFQRKEIIVVDNGSTDKSAAIVSKFGVNVLFQPKLGYGNACLAALAWIKNLELNPAWILICDGDGSDDPSDIQKLIDCFYKESADIVIGSRTTGVAEPGSLGFAQRFGNSLTCFLLNLFYGKSFSDLGPLRIIRYAKLISLGLKDPTWGWNIEMHIKALQQKLKIIEIPVNYRKRRFGVSKISGNVVMVIRVGTKILFTFFYLTLFSSSKKIR